MSEITGEIHFSLNCSECGSNEVSIENEDDSSRVTCNKCGADLGSWGEAKAAMFKDPQKRIEESMQKAFKKAFED